MAVSKWRGRREHRMAPMTAADPLLAWIVSHLRARRYNQPVNPLPPENP